MPTCEEVTVVPQPQRREPPSPVSDRVRVRRSPERGRYDRATIHAILDAGFVCHLGVVRDGQPVVVPTCYGRDGETLYVHGSAASRRLAAGASLPVCVTVTHVDGLVLARSAFHHSVNYRSVVVLGTGRLVTDHDAVDRALRVVTEHVVPGRWAEVRPPTPSERRATAVLAVDLSEASAKVRTGGPNDDPGDVDLPAWAGVLPLGVAPGAPLPGPDVRVALPASLRPWRRPGEPGPSRTSGRDT